MSEVVEVISWAEKKIGWTKKKILTEVGSGGINGIPLAAVKKLSRRG